MGVVLGHALRGEDGFLGAAHKGILDARGAAHREVHAAAHHEAYLVEVLARGDGEIDAGFVGARDGDEREAHARAAVARGRQRFLLGAVQVGVYLQGLDDVEREQAAARRGHHAEARLRAALVGVLDVAHADEGVGAYAGAHNLGEGGIVFQVFVGQVVQAVDPAAHAHGRHHAVHNARGAHQGAAVRHVEGGVGVGLLVDGPAVVRHAPPLVLRLRRDGRAGQQHNCRQDVSEKVLYIHDADGFNRFRCRSCRSNHRKTHTCGCGASRRRRPARRER